MIARRPYLDMHQRLFIGIFGGYVSFIACIATFHAIQMGLMFGGAGIFYFNVLLLAMFRLKR